MITNQKIKKKIISLKKKRFLIQVLPLEFSTKTVEKVLNITLFKEIRIDERHFLKACQIY